MELFVQTLAFRSWSAENGFHNQGLESFGLGSSHCFSGPLFRLLNCFLGMSLCRHPGCPRNWRVISVLPPLGGAVQTLSCVLKMASEPWDMARKPAFLGLGKSRRLPNPSNAVFLGLGRRHLPNLSNADCLGLGKRRHLPNPSNAAFWGWANVDVCPTPQMRFFWG